MPQTVPDGFEYEALRDGNQGRTLHGGQHGDSKILAEQVQAKFATSDAAIADLKRRLDIHEAVFGTAGESTDINLIDTLRTLVEVPVTVPSHWGTWVAEIVGTTQIENMGTGGGSAAADRRMTLRADDSSSNIGFGWQATLDDMKDDEVITATFSNPSGSAASGTITFRLRAMLTTNDSYRAAISTIAVTLHRLT